MLVLWHYVDGQETDTEGQWPLKSHYNGRVPEQLLGRKHCCTQRKAIKPRIR